MVLALFAETESDLIEEETCVQTQVGLFWIGFLI
jgi:hypothetical protein